MKVDVTQADRDRAADFDADRLGYSTPYQQEIRAGLHDDHKVVKHFAAHRQAALEEAAQKLRMIVSHATGGSSQDIDAPINDICVQISANRNLIYAHGKEVGLEEAAKVAEAHIHSRPVTSREKLETNLAAGITTAIRNLKGQPS